ncbi:hypothetical protein FRC07_004748 [Ceratobasidium sp. 392]|nr:hypothetical protein FRC07_004748 [Ceratobasidium sp. 392]
MQDDSLPSVPWDLYAVELGIFTSYADQLGPMEVVDSDMIQSPLALCTVRTMRDQRKIWISIAYNRSSTEDYKDVEGLGEDGKENAE